MRKLPPAARNRRSDDSTTRILDCDTLPESLYARAAGVYTGQDVRPSHSRNLTTHSQRILLMIGPVFSREALTAPRQPRFYATRALFVAGLLGIVLSAWQLLVGAQDIRNPGDLARFGEAVFALISPLLLTVCVLFSALLAAAAVAQEKDRKTLLLLLLSDLSNSELVLGKLLASMLSVLVVIAATAPLMLMLTLLGGISPAQVGGVMAVTVVSAFVAGSLGSLLALWREKTFQTLAMTALAIVLWFVFWEVVASGALGAELLGYPCQQIAAWMSPWQAIQAAVQPAFGPLKVAGETVAAPATSANLVNGFLVAGVSGALAINCTSIARIRIWNPSREARPPSDAQQDAQQNLKPDDFTKTPTTGEQNVHKAPGKVRQVWDNPILWRELRTWAYGKKILIVKFAYLVIFSLAAAAAVAATNEAAKNRSLNRPGVPTAAAPLAPLLAVSVVLVNALAVTSITGERDAKALDLLLATDLTPSELIFGKLAGAAYNAKEMILLPLLMCGYLWWTGGLSGENLGFLAIGLTILNFFAAMLGLHAGMIYPNSRHAIGASLGTLLFLFLGISTCMRMMLSLSASFEFQLVPFLGFMIGGGVALFGVLGWRNPSKAMLLACFAAPLATFYAITSFLLGQYGLVFAVTIATFGFATTAMLVPALAEFDVATGRTTAKD